MTGPGRPLWDPGAQPERTYQAWSRTALSVAGCGLLLTRLTVTSGAVALVLGAGVVVAAGVLAALQRRRLGTRDLGAGPYSVAAVTCTVVGVAAAALALLVVRAVG